MGTSVLANSYSGKSPAQAAAALARMERLDFSRQFSSPSGESLSNDNIMVFTGKYVLQYIIGTGTGYRYPVGTAVQV